MYIYIHIMYIYIHIMYIYIYYVSIHIMYVCMYKYILYILCIYIHILYIYIYIYTVYIMYRYDIRNVFTQPFQIPTSVSPSAILCSIASSRSSKSIETTAASTERLPSACCDARTKCCGFRRCGNHEMEMI